MFKVVSARPSVEHGGAHAHADASESVDLKEIERNEDELVRQLRIEANTANADFTKYAFRALAGSGVAFAAIIEFMFFSPFSMHEPGHMAQGQPFIGFAAVPVLIFVLMVLRMGTYAATLSNKLLGYGLYISRVRQMFEGEQGRWRAAYRRIGFEEAMRAWRIVQDSLFRTVCEERSFLRPHRYRRQFRPSTKNPMWFDQESLFGLGSNARWNEDSYLRVMQFLLLVAAGIAVVILCVTPPAIFYWKPLHGSQDLAGALFLDPDTKADLVAAATLFAGLGIVAVIVSHRNEKARRMLLADGILSIHSCAISWQAVILAHYTALARGRAMGLPSSELARATRRLSRAQLRDCREGKVKFEELLSRLGVKPSDGFVPDGAGYTGYSFWLGQEAESVERYAHDILGWIGVGEEGLRKLESKA